uniref:Uncharacterized protein n=1 Tax=Stomoxys calcitrans TaxID=35570 RepID=A0A1I8P3N8_STOCA
MNFFGFSIYESAATQSEQTAVVAAHQMSDSSLSSRNAFINFLQEYRQNHHTTSTHKPLWRMTIEAANRWNNMTLREKYSYIESAHNAKYIYRARDRDVNRILNLMRKSLTSKDTIDLPYLIKAAKHMKQWKRRILNEII